MPPASRALSPVSGGAYAPPGTAGRPPVSWLPGVAGMAGFCALEDMSVSPLFPPGHGFEG